MRSILVFFVVATSLPLYANDIIPTNVWTVFGSTNSTISGELIPVGTVVDAYDNTGVHCGRRFAGEVPGKYKALTVFGDEISTPVDEGCVYGERVVFKINGIVAEQLGPDSGHWVGMTSIRVVDLATSQTFDLGVTGPATGEGSAGSVVSYIATVENEGDGIDLISIGAESSLGWTIVSLEFPVDSLGETDLVFDPNTTFIRPGATIDVQIQLAIPMGANPGDVDQLTVTATSIFKPTTYASHIISTTVSGGTNFPPEVADIPDQTIAEGALFATISLDDYVEDPDHADSEMNWSYSNNSELSVTIDGSRVATIGIPHPDWFGVETITFTATDPGLLPDSDDAVFTITPINDPPVIADIPDQVVRHHRPFTTLFLDDFVTDIDDPDSQLLWIYSGNSVLTIDIDAQRIVTITPPSPDWTGTDTVIFTVTDTAMATDEDTVAFTRLENVPPEVPVLLSPTDDELVDTLFPVLTIQNSYDDDDDSLIYTFEVSLNSFFYFPQTFQKKADDDTTTSAIVQQILEENTRYWWRVRASDYYEESGFSEVQTFYVNAVNELPTVFSLIGPGSPAGEDITTQTPEFVWMLSTDPDPFDAISYTLFVAIDSNFSFVVSTSDITDTSHVIGYELLWETDYWWKVKAEDLHEGTTWSSEVFRFQPIPWTCGDADGSLVVEISDAVYLINYIFIPESPAPNPYESGDADCTGVVEISDAVYLINYIFIPGSPEPCDPDGDGEPDC